MRYRIALGPPRIAAQSYRMANKHKHQKSKPKKTDHSQRMNRLKAKALSVVADRAWAGRQRHKSITLLNEAVRRDPKNPDHLINLAAAYGKQRFYEKSEELLTRVVELAPRKANIYRRVGETYAQIDRPERAIECYRRALELNCDTSTTVQTLVELSGMYERCHQLDDAKGVIDDALARDPQNANVLMQQAILYRRRKEPTLAEPILRELADSPTRSPHARCQAAYELGQLLDDAQQFDAAFAAFVAAKRLLRPDAPPFIRMNNVVLHKNQEALAALDAPIYDRWKKKLTEEDQERTYRFAVLTGHPRSGTTLIEQVLDSHDELKSADEFDVFTEWIHQPIVRKFRPNTPLVPLLEMVPKAVWRMARATYWQQTEAIFNEPLGNRMLLDKNPGMMIMLPFVNWAFPEAKLLVALRDPRDVVLSCFMQKVTLTPISSCWLSLEEAAAYYAYVMNTWLTIRPFLAEMWCEFRYEDVVADLEKEARRILEFLGLPWDEKVLKFYEHAREKMVRSPTYRDVTQPVYHKSIGRWRHYAAHFEPVLDKLQPFVKEFGYD